MPKHFACTAVPQDLADKVVLQINKHVLAPPRCHPRPGPTLQKAFALHVRVLGSTTREWRRLMKLAAGLQSAIWFTCNDAHDANACLATFPLARALRFRGRSMPAARADGTAHAERRMQHVSGLDVAACSEVQRLYLCGLAELVDLSGPEGLADINVDRNP